MKTFLGDIIGKCIEILKRVTRMSWVTNMINLNNPSILSDGWLQLACHTELVRYGSTAVAGPQGLPTELTPGAGDTKANLWPG